MGNAVAAGRPQITIVNNTRRAVWVAIYKRSTLSTDEPPVAWQVVSPPPRGKTAIFTPREYQVCARYSFEPENHWRPVHQTNVLQVSHAPAGAGFVIESVASPDRRAWGAVLIRAAESPGWNQIRVVNRFLISAWCHVRQEGRDILPPRILPPMATLIEDLASHFYVAVLPSPRTAGDLLLNSEIALTETAVRAGESVKIQGGPYKGFRISRVPEGDPTSVEPDVRTGAQVPRTPEKKPQGKAKPKVDSRRRETAKKPAKKVARKTRSD